MSFEVPRAQIERSSFNRSRGHKTTWNAGWIVPVFVDEVLPGDSYNVQVSLLARLATQIVPVMDNLYLDLFFFFVPNRLIWSNWQKFCGEQENPGDSTDFLVPQVTLDMASIPAPPADGSTSGVFYNYLGVPIYQDVAGVYTFNNLHGRAYNLIWNEWFRDENLQTRAVVDKDDGPDNPDDYFVRFRGKRHDYFTSCLPWPQKGPGVEIPIAGLPIVGGGTAYMQDAAMTVDGPLTVGATSGSATNVQWGGGLTQAGGSLRWDDYTGLTVGSAVAGEPAGTINALREAYQIQRFLERDARGGTRYTEKIRSHFGVTSPDARLQRPEYLGGGSVPVVINPVVQTSGSPVDATGYTPTPQGNLAAFGVAAGSRRAGFVKSFTEHGVLLGLMSVRSDYTYQQGLPRMFSRRTIYDFYWPAFSHLGEQAVLNKEIYLQADGAPENDAVFGYQERWAEYRYGTSVVSGQFQSQYPQSLDFWHLAQDFATLPVLGDTFIRENPPVDRVLAVTAAPHFIGDFWFDVKCARPMPVFSVPGLSDHF